MVGRFITPGSRLKLVKCFKCAVTFVICVTAGIMAWRDSLDQQWARRFSNPSDLVNPRRACKKEDSDLVGLGWGPRFSLYRCCSCALLGTSGKAAAGPLCRPGVPSPVMAPGSVPCSIGSGRAHSFPPGVVGQERARGHGGLKRAASRASAAASRLSMIWEKPGGTDGRGGSGQRA